MYDLRPPGVGLRLIRQLLILCVLAVAATGTFSQSPDEPTNAPPTSLMPRRLDLESAIQAALDNNPQIKIADSSARMADLKISEARSARTPFVNFSQNVIRSNNPVFVFGSLLEQGRFTAANFELTRLNHPDGIINFRSQVAARMPIFDGRQTRANVSQAEIGSRQMRLAAEGARQQLRFEVIRAFYTTITAGEMQKVTAAYLEASEANRKKTRDMADIGMTTEADYLAAEVELATAGQQHLEAGSNFITSLADLNLTIGTEAGTELSLNGDLAERFFNVEERDRLISLALENRPDYKQAELAVEASKVKSRGVRDQKLPRVDAFGNYGYSSPYITNGSADYTLGISLTYNVFDPGLKSRVAQAAEGETLAELKLQNLANQIRLEVIRAHQDYLTAKAKIQISVASIARAEEARRIIDDRYRVGLTTFNEVLRAQAALVDARQTLLRSRFDYNISFARVLLSTGRLTDVRAFY
ncbi:MAG: TolC family protein [Pyrinomonadaceae bacterium]|nr:TolC family protein [Pyrinomonadaceae bacterium]